MLNKEEISVQPVELGESHFSTGKYHLLDIVFRRWSLLLQDTLYTEMDLMVDVSSENVEKMRFENFFKSISKQPMYIFETLNKSRGLFLIDNSFFLQFVLKTKAEKKIGSSSLDRLMNEHQKDLLSLILPMVDDFEKSWLNIAEVKINLNRVTIYPHRAEVMLPYEYCFVGRVKLSLRDIQSEIMICLPYSGVEPVLSSLDRTRVLAPESLEYYFPHVKQHFLDSLERTEHSVVAEIGMADLSETKGKLEIGQVIPLQSKDGLVTIKINGTPVLQGNTGESDGHYSVLVTRGLEEKKPSSIKQNREFKQVKWPSQ